MYDKSEDSARYNRQERGGWYCTNPKKHDEAQQHHTHAQGHEHPAERNDSQPNRNEDGRARYVRNNKAKSSASTSTADGSWRPMDTTPPQHKPFSHQTQARPFNPQAPINSNPEPEDPKPQPTDASGCSSIIVKIFKVLFALGLLQWLINHLLR